MSEYTPKQWIINNLFTSKTLKKLGELINGLVDKVDTVPSVNETAKVQYLTSQNGLITVGQNETPMYILDDTSTTGQNIYFSDINFSEVPFDELYNAVVNNKKVNVNIYSSDEGAGTTEVAGKAFVCGSTAYIDELYQLEPDTTKAIVISGTLIFKRRGVTIAKTFTYYTDESMSTTYPNDDAKYVKFVRVEDEQSANSNPLNVINITSTWDASVPNDSGYKITSMPNFATLKAVAMNGKPIIVNEFFDASIFSSYFTGVGYVSLHNSNYTEFYIDYVNPTNRFKVDFYCEDNTVEARVSNLGGFLPRHDSTMAGMSLKVQSDGSIAWSN